MPPSSYPATNDPSIWTATLSSKSRMWSCSHKDGALRDCSYCSTVSGTLFSRLQIIARKFPVSFQRGIHVRLGVEHHPVLKVATLFAVLEQHEGRNAQGRNDILKHHVHGQPEHLAIEKPAQNVCDDREGQDGEQVFRFQPEEGDASSKIAVHRCHFQCHLSISYRIPAVPCATKYSANRTSPDKSKHRPAATKCLIHPSVGWTRVMMPIRSAPAATCRPA